MHGCGNDYIYVNGFTETVLHRPQFARLVSDRHKGIGGDGVIFIDPSEVADCKMDMYNLDGSQGKMCGNGIRCVGAFAYENGLVNNTNMRVETLSGIKTLTLAVTDAKVCGVTVDMGAPIFSDNPLQSYDLHCVSMGNPHAVLFWADIPNAPVDTVGQTISKHPLFPEGVNVEFVHLRDREHMDFRVWERGSGETHACGTGACAAVAAAHRLGLCADSVTVHLLGGDLQIDIAPHTIRMTGEAVTVFEGDFPL